MKRIIISGAIIIGLIGGFLGLANSKDGQGATDSATLTFAAVQQEATNGARLYDVRTAEEYAAGHFAQSVNWPLQDMQAGSLPDVAADTKIYVYCRSGNRSEQAAAILEGAGYTNVVDLGGLSAVQSIGGTLTQ